MKRETFIQATGICGILFPIVMAITIGISLLQSPWFDWTKNAISDLYVVGIFNYGIVVSGMLAFIFIIGLNKMVSENLGVLFLGIATVGLIGIGVFPEPHPLHFPFAAILFLFIAIAFAAFSLAETPIPFFEYRMQSFARIVFIIAVLSLIPPIIFKGVAIPEVMVIVPASLWCMVYGARMMTIE